MFIEWVIFIEAIPWNYEFIKLKIKFVFFDAQNVLSKNIEKLLVLNSENQMKNIFTAIIFLSLSVNLGFSKTLELESYHSVLSELVGDS
jgi:hypothetical protein